MTPNGTIEYIVNSLAWSVVGAAMVLLYQRVRGNGKARKASMAGENETQPHRVNWVLVIAMSILVFAVISTVITWDVDHRYRQFVSCQATVNQARSDALVALQAIGAQDRQAVDRLVFSVANSTSREQTRAAFADYRATRERLERERKEHPLPEPENLCGPEPSSMGPALGSLLRRSR